MRILPHTHQFEVTQSGDLVVTGEIRALEDAGKTAFLAAPKPVEGQEEVKEEAKEEAKVEEVWFLLCC